MRLMDLTGNRYGRLAVLERGEDRVDASGKRRSMWLCKCDCGEQSLVLGGDLRSGDTRSCGCLRRERTAELRFTHGMTDHLLYGTWCSMVHRCMNRNHKDYHRYGGRGIRIYEPWQDDPSQFIDWVESELGERPEGMSIDRIDNNGPYAPGNLRWADAKTQANNRSVCCHTTQ